MNPQAIMTPGGIADQFTRGLSGVAQAFADRSRIDREAERDAFARQQAADALARQNEQMLYSRGRDTLADTRYAEQERLKMLGLAPETFTKDPILGGAATRALADQADIRNQREINLGLRGVPVTPTANAPVGSYVPADQMGRAQGYAAHNAAQAFELEKIKASADARSAIQKPLTDANTGFFRDANGNTIVLPLGEGIKQGLTPVKLDPTVNPLSAAKIKYEADAKKHAADRTAFVSQMMTWNPAESKDPAIAGKYMFWTDARKNAERMAAIAEWDKQNPTPTIQLDGTQNVQTMKPSASSAIGGADPLADDSIWK